MPITFPDGSVITSTALTPDTLGLILHKLTAQMLGYNPAGPSDIGYSKVRLDWPQSGQPAWPISDDVCFLRISEEDDEYNRIRDLNHRGYNDSTLQQIYTYTRVWGVTFTLYGPNCSDQARVIRDALFLDWTMDVLSGSNIYVVDSIEAPVYLPELFQSSWWKRCDLKVQFYELVTTTTTVSAMASAEVILETEHGIVADITVR